MRLALAAMTMSVALLAALPVASAATSPYAGTWEAFATPTVRGTSSCDPGLPLGQELRQGTIPIGSDGTFSRAAGSSVYDLLLRIGSNGSLSLTLTPTVEGCPASAGSGTCSTIHCDGNVTSDDGAAFTFRLERVVQGAAADSANQVFVTRDHVIVAPADSSRMIRLSDESTLHVKSGPDGATVNITATVASDPSRLPEPRRALSGPAVGRLYFQLDSAIRAGDLRSATLTVDLGALGLPVDAGGAEVQFHYWTGKRWALLEEDTQVAGEGEPDLQVLDRDIDVADGFAKLKVNHLSAYAVTLQTTQPADSSANTSEAPAPPAALLLLALAALALLRRGGPKGLR
jgi:MYXO-CTERM domain-containing protein